MTQNYSYRLFIAITSLLISAGLSAQTTFNYTGAMQTYTVPAGVTSIQIEAYGAQGGGAYGGNGGEAIATVPTTPGAVLEVYVGGQPLVQLGPGGFNGGGAVTAVPCGGGPDGWPGGGASDVRTTSSLSDRLVVGGGGGGTGYSDGLGGSGGGSTGSDGEASWIAGTQGLGGTQSAGGLGGVYGTSPGSPAPSGTFGFGGNSSPLNTYCTGGGGGGGWYGGGGGYVSAGAGGSSYISFSGSTNTATNPGVNTGNGYVIMTEMCVSLTSTNTNATICEGDLITLTATSTTGGTVTWDNGATNGIAFSPAGIGTTTYTATSDSGGDCGFSVDIEVIAAPNVVASVADATVCVGDMITLTGSGASTYVWDNGATDGVAYDPGVGSGFVMFHVTGTDVTGCSNIDSLEVFFSDPIINAVIVNELSGGDGSIDITVTGGTGAYLYSWLSGQVTEDISGLFAGNYTVTVDDGACIVDSTFTIFNVLGLDKAEVFAYSVYPNPTSNFLNVEVQGEFGLELVNILGKKVFVGTAKNKVLMDLSKYDSGIYFLTLSKNNSTRQIKILVQHKDL